MDPMSSCDLAITVERERRAEIDAIAGSLRALGLEVDRVIPQIGAIYGRGDEGCVAAAQRVAGVARVRLAGGVQLAPFEPHRPQ